jgi:uncharacterized membrane protein YraQ (UPF0718 family)
MVKALMEYNGNGDDFPSFMDEKSFWVEKENKMDVLLWLSIGFFIIGLIVLLVIKRKIERKKYATANFKVRFIVATTIWGVVCINLVPWWFSKMS